MSTVRWTLGLNHGPHDSSAALLRNGRLAVIAEQERFSRAKCALDEAPCDAAKYCLDYCGISLGDVERVALGLDCDLLRAWLGWDAACPGWEAAKAAKDLTRDDPDRLFPRKIFGPLQLPPLQPILHHTAHAASAFWASGFTEAAVLVADGRGEEVSTTLGYGSPDGFEILETYPISHSLGSYYKRAALYAGLYTRSGGVGKFMGLAAYGRPNQPVPLVAAQGGYQFCLQAPSDKLHGHLVMTERIAQLLTFFERNCYPFTRGLSAEVMSYANFAASVQTSLELALLELARQLRRLTWSRNLAIAGGIGFNCTANGRIVRDSGFANVYVQPMAGDSGVALGAAIAAEVEHHGPAAVDTRMQHAYYGPNYDQQTIEAALTNQGVAFRRCKETDLISRVADLIKCGHIVAWYQGRAEVGPRALGARSLLGDPRRRETLVRLNQAKGREMWRPIAPSVLEPDWYDYFEESRPDPFMIVSAQVKPARQAEIPAVVHVDGSARPQAVSARATPRYAQLIAEFGRRTGVPILANTSFNLQDEPIVNTPADAVRTYVRGRFDALAIGDCLAIQPEVERGGSATSTRAGD